MVLRVWGTAISGAGHAVVLGLAIWALPWLRARPGPVVPVVLVRLVDPAELLPPAPPPPPPPAPPPVSTERPEATVPHPEIPEEVPVEEGLAQRFDPASPLGFQSSGAVVPDPADPMEPPTVAPPPEPQTEPLPEAEPEGVEAFRAAVLAAVQAAKVTPPIARQRGLFGTTRVSLLVGPAGEVVEVRVVQSSGAKALDDAALKAVRNARLPAPPWGAPVAYDLGISFTLRDN